MNDTVFRSARAAAAGGRLRRLDRLAKRLVVERLRQLDYGAITLQDGDDRYLFGDACAARTACIRVEQAAFYSDAAYGGALGAGEAYIRGAWDCDDLVALVRILLRNRDVLDGMDSGFARLKAPLRRLAHFLNRNSRSGSRRNIAAHYDLGNDFYRLWLDRKMMYSSAWFADANTGLETAATAKLDRICRKLDLGPDDRVVEIGSGWGGFALHAARVYGCHVTTTTISAQQYRFVSEAVERAGLGDRICVLNKDYRDLDGRYDKLVSIEMIEAVGHQFMDRFFARCSALLEPHGEMLLQAITIADQRYDAARKHVDFIKRFVFPGGFLPSLTAMNVSMTRVSQLRAVHVEDIGPHYARTLNHWRERFIGRLDEVRGLGFDETFIRLWYYYLCYCEAAFLERAIGNVQLHAIMPDARPGMGRAW